MRSSVAFLVLGASVGVLAGCSPVPNETRAAYEVPSPGQLGALPMAQLPSAAGDVVSVIESVDHGVITQKVVLKGDAATWGENGIVVVVDQNADRRAGESRWVTPKPTESLIARELQENFADINMGVGQTYTRNSLGPFGYALGKTGSDITCLYAWQYSAGRPLTFVHDPAVEAVISSQPASPTSVRVRLCKQHAVQTELVAMVSQMAVFAPHTQAPYLDPTYKPSEPGAADALEATGLPGAYYAGTKRTAELEADSAPAPRAHRHRRHHARHRHAHRVARADPPFAEQPGDLAPVIVPPLAGGPVTSVPLAGAPTSPSAAPIASNPLTAPLKAALAARKTAAADDLPLPGGPAKGAAPAAASAAPAPIPLPQ